MRSIRRLLVVAAATLALASLAPTASASSDKAFHLAKTCAGFTCTITSSSYKGIPAGTVISYSGDGLDALVAVIDAPHGTTTGNCNIASVFGDPAAPGVCTFDAGTGSLSAFHLTVAVTYDSTIDVWYWDGTYSHGSDG
jgi:hypothetical protein